MKASYRFHVRELTQPYEERTLRQLRYTQHKSGWLSPIYEVVRPDLSVLDLRADGLVFVRQATLEFAARCREQG